MLSKFEVKNFKGFKDFLVFDLNSREYNYNKSLVENGVVKKSLIYGKNGSGKTNVGLAIFDIIIHLTDKEKKLNYYGNYSNLDLNDDLTEFKYHFNFNNQDVLYEYGKKGKEELVYEKLTDGDDVLVDYHYFDNGKKYVKETIKSKLQIDLNDNKLSIIKYIYRSLPTNTVPAITKMFLFVENMLWYRSLSDGNAYMGYQNGSSSLGELIINNNTLEDFQKFLSEFDLNYSLKISDSDKKMIERIFSTGKFVSFDSIASTGTKALELFYVWKLSFFNIKFLFIDEFDAFLHYEASERLVNILNSFNETQVILTTHNLRLMNNKTTRPDCCFIINDNKEIKCLSELIGKKDIRESNNLENMYINDAFKF